MDNQINGDNWREWFNEWGDRFLLFARQQANTYPEAEDILQEAMVHIWSKRDLFPRIEPGLVFTQIRRKAIDRARKDKRRRIREEAYAADNDPPFFEESQDDSPKELQEAMQQLPLDQREVLVTCPQ